MRMKKYYVATPIKHYFENYDNKKALELARNHAIAVSREVKKLGVIPVSAPLMMLGVYEEPEERELAIKIGLAILNGCDGIAYRECDLSLSDGMRYELAVAKTLGIEIKKL